MGPFLAQRIIYLIPLILSLTVHEFAHAWSAHLLGDDTASAQGRLTLNPLVHLDPLGTFLLPLLGIPFGWAKPVPVNPTRFTRKIHMPTGMMITAIAGPAANVVLALLCAVAFGLLVRNAPDWLESHEAVTGLLKVGQKMNAALAIFNMLPIPPLDGSRVLERFVPTRHRSSWASFTLLGPVLLAVVLVTGGHFLAGPMGWADQYLDLLSWRVALLGRG